MQKKDPEKKTCWQWIENRPLRKDIQHGHSFQCRNYLSLYVLKSMEEW